MSKQLDPQVLTEMSAELDTWMEEVAGPAALLESATLGPSLWGIRARKFCPPATTKPWPGSHGIPTKPRSNILDLLYCYQNRSLAGDEEWFKIPVPFNHEDGWAEVEIPEGAQSYLFNLIDENLFLLQFGRSDRPFGQCLS